MPVPGHQSERTGETIDEHRDTTIATAGELRGTMIGTGTAGGGPGPGRGLVIDTRVGDLTDAIGADLGLDPETGDLDASHETRYTHSQNQHLNSKRFEDM